MNARESIAWGALTLLMAFATSGRWTSLNAVCHVPSSHPAIQTAIDDTLCATVVLAPGTYKVSLRLSRSVTLAAEQPEQVRLVAANPEKPVIYSASLNPVEIELRQLVLTGGVHGIAAEGRASLKVFDSLVAGNERSGVWVWGHARLLLSGSRLSSNLYGALVEGFARAQITNNRVEGNRAGLEVEGEAQASITDNTLEKNYYGLIIWSDATAVVDSNTVTGNQDTGILLGIRSKSEILRNRLADNGRYHVGLFQSPCYITPELFSGVVTGGENDMAAAGQGDVCPSSLTFLKK